MKAITAFFTAICLLFCASAEISPTIIDNAFSLVIPETWLECAPADETAAPLICLSDGQTVLTIEREEIPQEYASLELQQMYLMENGHVEAFVSTFSDAEDAPQFILYNHLESSTALCRTLIPEKGMYTFSFSPVAPDAEYGQTILDMMATFTITDDTGAE